MNERKYAFSWDLLGDIQNGRPNLGNSTRLEIYRLMQFSFRNVIERRYGTAETDQIFREAGKLAGQAFIRELQGAFREMGVGSCELKRRTSQRAPSRSLSVRT